MILGENKPALLGTKSEDLLVKSEDATTVEMQVPTVYWIKHGKIWSDSCLFFEHYSSC